jgi:hypothetical protein
MILSVRSKVSVMLPLIAFVTILGGIATLAPAQAASSSTHAYMNCVTTRLCADVAESDEAFGHYVGHDEPSNLFYSDRPGSGNRMSWKLTLPTDPHTEQGNVPSSDKKSFNFQLHPAFWFGMAMCDTQSDPNPGRVACKPDSDTNIFDNPSPTAPDSISKHPGTAFMEMQFYPPGWVAWPAARVVGGTSCDARQWCAALNIDSLSRDPINGTLQNPTCQAIAGLEYVNFAFITKNGKTQAPANPVQSNLTTFTPDRHKDLFMNSGDKLAVTMRDTEDGLRIDIQDRTTGEHGFMVASAKNGFGQVKYDPTGTSCQNIPYDFHPMYSTSSPHTRVPWAAHSYNIAFSDEIGHFDYCTGRTPIPATQFGIDPTTGNPISCPVGNFEGVKGDKEPTDGDDNFCFPASRSTLIKVAGCTDSNSGFDGVSYKPLWPDGSRNHPTPILFSSPLTGEDYNRNYARSAFETDLPDLEASCTILSANDPGCTLIPTTDDGTPADFYPYFSTRYRGDNNNQNRGENQCMWQIGGAIPDSNLFGKNAQYGTLLAQVHLRFGGHGATRVIYPDFQGVINNPCKLS